MEKHNIAQLEEAASQSKEVIEHEEEDEEFTPEEQKRIIRRIDRRLIVTCGIMYCISLMDRTNLSAAAIAGMIVELQLINFRYVSPTDGK